MLHLLTCPGLRTVRDHVSRLITALGAKAHDIHQPTTVLLLLDSNYKLLDELPRAIIHIYWRLAYAGLSKASDEHKRFPNPTTSIHKAIYRSLMLRILAYQKRKSYFYRKRVYTHKVSVVTGQDTRGQPGTTSSRNSSPWEVGGQLHPQADFTGIRSLDGLQRRRKRLTWPNKNNAINPVSVLTELDL